ncbi:MAG: glycosyltransferase family 4 protein, partial [bacterium]|nr:glycosyltransferase family 4 protein [bacterium]
MKILLLTQYFPPEIGAAPHRAFYHARHWVQMGHQVTVVTNFPNSPFGKIFEGFKNRLFRKESVEGITVVRILTLPAGKKSNIIKRLLNSLLYVFMTGIFFFRRKPDVIVGSAPFFAGFAAFMLAKVRGVPLVYEMRDPWLQAIEKNVRQTGLFSRLMMTLENFCLHRADKVVVIGETMSRFIARHYGLKRKPVPVFNGIEKEDIENIP